MKNKMFKALVLLLAVALMATQMVVPVLAVAETTECECDAEARTGTVVETVDPTCSEFGYDVLECDECGGVFFKLTTAPTGVHVIVEHDGKEATCTEAGWEAYQTCEQCDYTTYAAIEALGHEYDDVVTEPNCTEQGYTTHTCIRGDHTYVDSYTKPYGHTPGEIVIENNVDPECEVPGSYDEVIYCTVCPAELLRNHVPVDALEHDWKEIEKVDADCTNDGYITYECGICFDTYTEVIACPGKHDYAKVVTPADCHSAEKVEYTCKECGYYFEEFVGEPLDHVVIIDAAVEPTCTETGLTEGSHCDICGDVIIAQEVVPALDHDYVGVVTAPTCSAEGYTTYTCSRCFDSYVADYVDIDPLSHRAVIVKEAVKATCTETGLTYELACGDCGLLIAAQKETAIDPTNHNYVGEVTAPNCTEGGYTTYTCSRCDDSYVADEVDPDGHDLTEVEAKEETCTDIGWNAYEYCNKCDYTTYVEIPELGHDEKIDVVDPTCTEDGYTIHTCSRCDYYLEDTIVEAPGHDKKDSIGDVHAPTCDEKGYTVYKCAVCTEVFRSDYVDALGHDVVEVEAQAPTCDEIGWDAYDYCSRGCYNNYEEIPALGHDLVEVEAQAPTCTEIGWEAYYECQREGCDYTEGYVEIPALRHHIVVVDPKAPTCDEVGWDVYVYCTVCDYTTYVEIPALGHDLVEVEAQAPTCTENGWTAHEYCNNCDYSTEKAIPPTGHTEVVDAAVLPTYDETGLTEGSHCEVCGEIIVAQEVVDRLSEEIEFTYEATGINGVDKAVNSGYVYVNVYMNVLSDIARLHGIDFALDFNENLTLISVDGCIFNVNDSTNLIDANAAHRVILAQNMGFETDKEFAKGEYLFATLVFKVANDFYYQDAEINFVELSGTFARDEDVLKNEMVVDYGTGAIINVTMLGDSNEDGVINSKDTLAFSKWFASALLDDFNTVYDMNKDGFIDGDDFVLLRGAVVGNNDYLN